MNPDGSNESRAPTDGRGRPRQLSILANHQHGRSSRVGPSPVRGAWRHALSLRSVPAFSPSSSIASSPPPRARARSLVKSYATVEFSSMALIR